MAGSETGTQKCEFSNATHEGNEDDLEENSNYTYQGAKVRINLEFSIFSQ